MFPESNQEATFCVSSLVVFGGRSWERPRQIITSDSYFRVVSWLQAECQRSSIGHPKDSKRGKAGPSSYQQVILTAVDELGEWSDRKLGPQTGKRCETDRRTLGITPHS